MVQKKTISRCLTNLNLSMQPLLQFGILPPPLVQFCHTHQARRRCSYLQNMYHLCQSFCSEDDGVIQGASAHPMWVFWAGKSRIWNLELSERECTLGEVEKARDPNNRIITLSRDNLRPPQKARSTAA